MVPPEDRPTRVRHGVMAYLCALAGLAAVGAAIAVPEVRAWVSELLHTEAVPTLDTIPGHPPEEYVASVLTRFENTGISDGIPRICADGSAKLPAFLIPTIEAQLARDGLVERVRRA